MSFDLQYVAIPSIADSSAWPLLLMESRRSVFSKLPAEIIEHVLAFLPVPVLCRIRCVWKSWIELISRPSFHDLCDLNGEKDAYLFFYRSSESFWPDFHGPNIDPSFLETYCFLDLEARRWYSIAAQLHRFEGCGNKTETQVLSIDDGLVCELTTPAQMNRKYALAILDPVAQTKRALPVLPESIATEFIPPQILSIVEYATRSYKVFLLNNLARNAQLRVHVHESFTNDWRELRKLPSKVQDMGWPALHQSAVVLHQSLFVINKTQTRDQLRLFRYKLQGNKWVEVHQMSYRERVVVLQLVVSGNRLFLNMWSKPRFRSHPLPSRHSCPDSESLFQTNQDSPFFLFEMYEILIADYSRKPALQLTEAQLKQIFGKHDSDFNIWHARYGFPCFDSDGICNSVVLVSTITSLVRMYHLETGSVNILPPYPLMPTSKNDYIGDDYTALIMEKA